MKHVLGTLIFLLCCITFDAQRRSCSSPIYCEGELLHLIQKSKIFNDSKTFVDMAMKNPVNKTLENFDLFMRKTDSKPTVNEINMFVQENFQMVGEMEDFYPRDWRAEPRIVKEIEDPKVRNFLKTLISIWPQLCRKISQYVFDQPERFSLIPVRNAFIIPGGRFKEFYYWDSYWILKGLLLTDMKETAKGVIDNFLFMVSTYGFIPNGGRVYYLNRSQPPVLTLMMKDYIKYTKDFEFLRQNIHVLEQELQFWLKKRVVKLNLNGEIYQLAHFDSESNTPRPESYLEDLKTCSVYNTTEAIQECYTDLKSGAESGWDFSSRWIFDEKGEPSDDLSKIHTRRNIPVDLNSFLYKSFKIMQNFYQILRQPTDAKYWQEVAEMWQYNIERVLYSPDDGIWFDYDIKLNRPRKYFAASNFAPLWAEAMDEEVKKERGSNAVQYLKKYGILDYHGIPSTLFNTGLQWDFPNVWSPYQNIIIFGLEQTGDEEAQEVARVLALRWVQSNIKAYDENKVMFEKYSAKVSGAFGGGGEYHIQSGFGWTNGAIMEIIDSYFRVKSRKYIAATD
ncbi:trehalase-like [Anthonomus grandis grandis]|uniref:trehalase-like n=1 Tax=Anthonomus grandis grandis TaxID=2921223 RepID=UPI0021652322|nr:trehalase-like [Anthonomus grandis grandis]